MKQRVGRFVGFCYDFVVGDDWLTALGVIAALALTYALSSATIPAWWVLPAAVTILLPLSLWRATRRRGGRAG